MLTIPQNTRAIIFDCDGTLIDNMPLHLQAWQKAFETFGKPFEPEFLEITSGMPFVDTVEFYNDKYDCSLDPAALAPHKDKTFETLMHSAQPIHDVCDLAREYKGRLPMAVVSGSRRTCVDLALNQVGLENFFEIILTANDPFKGKPAPDLFLEAARLMNVNPADCIVLEDGESGMEGARRAGMSVIDVRPIVDAQRATISV